MKRLLFIGSCLVGFSLIHSTDISMDKRGYVVMENLTSSFVHGLSRLALYDSIVSGVVGDDKANITANSVKLYRSRVAKLYSQCDVTAGEKSHIDMLEKTGNLYVQDNACIDKIQTVNHLTAYNSVVRNIDKLTAYLYCNNCREGQVYHVDGSVQLINTQLKNLVVENRRNQQTHMHLSSMLSNNKLEFLKTDSDKKHEDICGHSIDIQNCSVENISVWNEKSMSSKPVTVKSPRIPIGISFSDGDKNCVKTDRKDMVTVLNGSVKTLDE